ncbi:cytochrome b [Pusillimonas sp. ANT_WB101]|uniref:cytochrome b n=1 Tax=Pusillimonas sp. ANT_WB101 TaxID=2597356 RepID=UPI0011EE4338|nr:cytochrome b [Pusillimonas sp. ANT_WB101]KAA0889352.1 cytochrome b [Pusillimonas sp. ANT_WB101]
MNDLHYSLWGRRLHWLVFILVAAALTMIYAHGWSPKGSTIRAVFKWSHMQFGIVILLVMLPRIVVRWRSGRPSIVPPPPRWQEQLAHAVQFVLYVLLFIVPLLGIANRLWSPDAWNFLGITLPHVAVTDKGFSEQLEEIHGTLGNVLMYLAGAHAVIALVHHFLLHDSTLRNMLPFWRSADASRTNTKTRIDTQGE